MINYPNGTIYKPKKAKTNKISKIELSISSANRGMNLENDINFSNVFYNETDKALIYKRPTPIKVVKTDYTKGCQITEAYFEKQSTTDYNGIYRNRYIDFEAKSTKSSTSFPLANISSHQLEHLKRVIQHGGIAFFIIEITKTGKIYLLKAEYILDFCSKNMRKSIPFDEIVKNGVEIKRGLSPRLEYLDAVDKAYFL